MVMQWWCNSGCNSGCNGHAMVVPWWCNSGCNGGAMVGAAVGAMVGVQHTLGGGNQPPECPRNSLLQISSLQHPPALFLGS